MINISVNADDAEELLDHLFGKYNITNMDLISMGNGCRNNKGDISMNLTRCCDPKPTDEEITDAINNR